MTNLEALRSLCNAIANTFYPDGATIELMLFNEGIDPQAEATPKDASLFRVAVCMVKGYVEQSRTEGGVSTSVREDSIKGSIKHYCAVYGLDAEDIISDEMRVIENGSNLW